MCPRIPRSAEGATTRYRHAPYLEPLLLLNHPFLQLSPATDRPQTRYDRVIYGPRPHTRAAATSHLPRLALADSADPRIHPLFPWRAIALVSSWLSMLLLPLCGRPHCPGWGTPSYALLLSAAHAPRRCLTTLVALVCGQQYCFLLCSRSLNLTSLVFTHKQTTLLY